MSKWKSDGERNWSTQVGEKTVEVTRITAKGKKHFIITVCHPGVSIKYMNERAQLADSQHQAVRYKKYQDAIDTAEVLIRENALT